MQGFLSALGRAFGWHVMSVQFKVLSEALLPNRAGFFSKRTRNLFRNVIEGKGILILIL